MTLAQGETSTGKVYFDVVDRNPMESFTTTAQARYSCGAVRAAWQCLCRWTIARCAPPWIGRARRRRDVSVLGQRRIGHQNPFPNRSPNQSVADLSLPTVRGPRGTVTGQVSRTLRWTSIGATPNISWKARLAWELSVKPAA